MRDPIEELENFTVPGTPMTPLPAAEVRRRGDRIRRRRNVLAGAAAVAVVAAIVTPIAVLADRDDDRSVDPAPAPEWVQKVPDAFPLSHGLFSAPPVTARSGADDLALCGTTAWSPTDPVATVDLAGARYAENEAHMGRTLALYPDSKAAEAAMSAIRSGVLDCPRDENGGGLPLVNHLETLDLGGDEGATVVQQAENDGGYSDLTVWEVVRYGNALFVDSSYGAAGGEDVIASTSALLADRSEAVRSQMCVFSAEPCATPAPIPEKSSDPGTGEGAVSAIPSGLQLGRGLSSPEGDPVDGPSATAEGVPALDLCGSSVWPVTGVERLAVTVSGPEYRENRELVTFSSSADLTAAMDALRSVADASCTPDGRVLTPYDEQVGDDAVTFALTYTDGLGLDIYQFVRVGRSLLATHRMTEGSLESAKQSVPDVTKANRDLVPDLCPFTKRGC
ncbi:hypothetical protein [Nocardioides sp. T2.26MG-1]|uniref:hypothetical protein n=1 Tax=Nocardioides sp. T2.26MG-1 TaxID=3041166 RepID=UPI002477520C|nr:hypothetical protein [Nocardioides sp. T2.26MG-1]CAI9405599.1 hypothetical protein HIDPHFAB_04418 [Nocardioides sp. T2.26MG-1]